MQRPREHGRPRLHGAALIAISCSLCLLLPTAAMAIAGFDGNSERPGKKGKARRLNWRVSRPRAHVSWAASAQEGTAASRRKLASQIHRSIPTPTPTPCV
jgi:hypothetical protein